MILIGEKLNSSVPKTLAALESGDMGYITELIKAQSEADYLDINTALTREKEKDNMRAVIALALEHSGCGIMLDSPSPEVIADCIEAAGDRPVMINSITLEEKYDELIALIAEKGAGVVCLPIEGRAIPESAEKRAENAAAMTEKLRAAGVKDDKIFIDALVEAVATNDAAAAVTLETIKLVKQRLPGVHIVCGLSNISFGLPQRAKLNAAFLTMAMQNGLDSVIADVTSESIQDAMHMADLLLGRDEYCMEYIGYIRNK